MARVIAFVPDLLFGSRVQGLLVAGGHDVVLEGDRERALAAATNADVLLVDLTAGADPRGLAGVARKTMGFFAHVEPEVRAAALDASFDLVVPRSRMNREGAALVSQLAGRESFAD